MTGANLFSAGSARMKAGLLAFAATAVLVVSQARAADAVDASQPAALIQTSSQSLLKSLDANREVYRKDIKQLYKLVDEVFVPHFDVDFAAQQVLGKHWRTATPEQRKRFIAAFYQSLLQTYGDSLVEFTGDRMKVLPFQGDAAAPRATVRTEVRRSNGAAVAVNYSLRKMPAGTWKVWDVVIEGISYVKSFREDYGLEVDQKGLEPLIQRLEANAKGGKA